MAKFIGRRVNVGIGLESTRGTGVAATYALPKTNYTFNDKANKARSGESLCVISGEGNQAIVTGRFSEGVIEGELNAKSFPCIMRCALGAVSTAAAGTGYKHTFTVLESNQHPTLSVHLDDVIGDTIFEGCMVDTLEITVVPDDIVKYSLTLKGKKGQSSTYTATQVVDYKFVGRDLVLKVGAATTDLAAATAISVKELKLTISKNTDYDWVLGTLEPEDVLNKQISIQGSLTLNYEDRTWRDYMLDGSTKAVGIKLEQTRDDAGDQNPTFYIEFPKVDFSEWESAMGNDDIVSQTINFTALYNTTTSKLVSDAYIINDIATY